MRFNDYDAEFAILYSPGGGPIKIRADEASKLSAWVYQYNDTLYKLLLAAYAKDDREEIDRLWAAAHPFAKIADHHDNP
jgi:hypothetical protein